MGHTNLIVDDPFAHEDEHSLEVQMPFVQRLFPGVRVVPIMIPVSKTAVDVGQAVGRTLQSYKYEGMVVGTTDLTHYGPSYGFVPYGLGKDALRWAKEDNDRRFIELVCAMQDGELLHEAAKRHNACNAGAAAATIAAVRVLGATRGVVLEHTTSSEVLGGDHADSVGYAAIVFE